MGSLLLRVRFNLDDHFGCFAALGSMSQIGRLFFFQAGSTRDEVTPMSFRHSQLVEVRNSIWISRMEEVDKSQPEKEHGWLAWPCTTLQSKDMMKSP